MDQLVTLYEDYAYECYLTNQLQDAIIYQGKALKIWEEKNEIEKLGNSLRLFWQDFGGSMVTVRKPRALRAEPSKF